MTVHVGASRQHRVPAPSGPDGGTSKGPGDVPNPKCGSRAARCSYERAAPLRGGLDMTFSMSALPRTLVCTASALVLLMSGAIGGPATASANNSRRPAPGAQLERLDRGLVAATTSEGIFLSWRLLGHEATGHSAGGGNGPGLRVFLGGGTRAP